MGTHCHIKCNLEDWFITKSKWYPEKCWMCHHVLAGGAGQDSVWLLGTVCSTWPVNGLPRPFFFFKEKRGERRKRQTLVNTVYALAHFHPKKPERGNISPILRMRRVWLRQVRQPALGTHKQGDPQVAQTQHSDLGWACVPSCHCIFSLDDQGPWDSPHTRHPWILNNIMPSTKFPRVRCSHIRAGQGCSSGTPKGRCGYHILVLRIWCDPVLRTCCTYPSLALKSQTTWGHTPLCVSPDLSNGTNTQYVLNNHSV